MTDTRARSIKRLIETGVDAEDLPNELAFVRDMIESIESRTGDAIAAEIRTHRIIEIHQLARGAKRRLTALIHQVEGKS